VNPIYDELAALRGIDVPEDPDPMPTYTPLFSAPPAPVDPDRMPPEHQHEHGGDLGEGPG
jgi:hypothetical protein